MTMATCASNPVHHPRPDRFLTQAIRRSLPALGYAPQTTFSLMKALREEVVGRKVSVDAALLRLSETKSVRSSRRIGRAETTDTGPALGTWWRSDDDSAVIKVCWVGRVSGNYVFVNRNGQRMLEQPLSEIAARVAPCALTPVDAAGGETILQRLMVALSACAQESSGVPA